MAKVYPKGRIESIKSRELLQEPDAIVIHGAAISVDVHNAYVSELLKSKIAVVAGRTVRLLEDGGQWAPAHLAPAHPRRAS